MKLPIPFLLYLVSVGLLGFAGWTVYKVLPQWKGDARTAATNQGYADGAERLDRGKSQGKQTVDWDYGPSTMAWWDTLKVTNLTGKLPPPPPVAVEKQPEKHVEVDVRPLEEIIELVSLVYDGKDGGKGGSSHVIVRYKPEANVEPPEWWVRENAAPTPSSTAPTAQVPVRGDMTPGRGGGGNRPPGGQPAQPPKSGGARATTTPPLATTNREMLQKLWIQDNGDPRRSAELWPVKARDPAATLGKIRLVRVAADAQSAWFVRELPPAKPGDPPPPPKEEELLKTSANLSQDVLQELRRLQGGSPVVVEKRPAPEAQGDNTKWVNSRITEKFGNVVNIGLDDEERFRDANNDVFDQIYVDTYVSRDGKTRGLIVKNVDADIARKFGVSPGEVLIEVNGKKVESQAQAIQSGKKDYQKGVRTFDTKWMVNGAVITRTFRAPDKK